MAGVLDSLDELLGGRPAQAAQEARRWMVQSDDDVSRGDMISLLVKSGLAEPVLDKPRALHHDPYSVSDWGGWRQRPNGISFATMREMSAQCAPITAVLQTRTNQIGAFCRPQRGRYDAGYRVVARDREAAKRAMTPAEAKEAQSIERMIETTGVLLPGEKPIYRDGFKAYVKKSTRDILRYDSWATEIQRDKFGRPSRFAAVDGATIRPSVIDFERLDLSQQRELVSYVQVWEEQVIAEFTRDQLAVHVMNPRTDLRAAGYGYGPVEQVVRLVTAWLFGFDYNQNFFKQGSAIKGLINIKGTIPDRQMRAFRRMWYSMVGGVQNAWKTPILNADDVQWMSMHTANREMEFSAWMDWLTKLITAIFGVDPVEINFQFGNTGQSSTLSEGNNEEKVTESKDKGLRPLVEHIQDGITQIVQDINPDFEFSFAGLDVDAERREKEAKISETKAFVTVDETRAFFDMPPLPGSRGQVILDTNWKAWVDSQEGGGDAAGGMPDAPGAPGAPDGSEGLMDGSDNPDAPDDDEDDDLLSFAGDGPDDDEEDDLLAASMAAVQVAAQDVLRKAHISEQTAHGRRRTTISYTR